MAKIFNTTVYPTIVPAATDLLIGTDVSDNNKTVTFLISDIVGGGGAAQDLASVLSVGNTASNNIILTGTGILTAVDVFPTVLSAGAQGSHGLNGQFLMSTGTGLQWSTPTGGTLTWNQVVTNGNTVSSQNIFLSNGSFSITQPGLVAAELSGDINTALNWAGIADFRNNVLIGDPTGTTPNYKLLLQKQTEVWAEDGITPGTQSKGIVGQFLQSTATGVQWSSSKTLNNPTLQDVCTPTASNANVLTGVGIEFVGTNSGSNTTFDSNTILTSTGTVRVIGNADVTVPSTQGFLNVSGGALDLQGKHTELRLEGGAGTSGQLLVSQGPLVTPIWSTITGLSQNLQNVLDNGNTATGANANILLTGNGSGTTAATQGILTLDAGSLNLTGSYTPIYLGASTGTAGQVLTSAGPFLTPIWAASGGGGSVNTITGLSSNYVATTISGTAANPNILSTLRVTGTSIPSGTGVVIEEDISLNGTNYTPTNNVVCTTVTGSGSGYTINVLSATIQNSNDFTVVSGGTGYAVGDTVLVPGSVGGISAIIQVFSISSDRYYDANGKFSKAPGNDWDLAWNPVTGVVASIGVAGSNGTGWPATVSNVPVNAGSATGLTCTINASGGTVTSATIDTPGTGYTAGVVFLGISNPFGGGINARIAVLTTTGTQILSNTDDDSRTSSVQFKEGTNIELTKSSANNSITISSSAGGGTVSSVGIASTNATLSVSGGPITSSGILDVEMPATGVTANAYTSADITVDAFGRITAAADGSGNTDTTYDLTSSQNGPVELMSNPAGGTLYVAGSTVNTTVLTGSGDGNLTVLIGTVQAVSGAINANQITIVNAGADYSVGDTFTVLGPGADVTGTVTQVSSLTASINLIPSTGTTDAVVLKEGTNIRLVDNGANEITITSSGTFSFTAVTNPVSASALIDGSTNTLTFTEQVNTIVGVNYNYIGLDISATNVLTVGLKADTSALNASTKLTSFLRADNTWATPAGAGGVTTLNTLSGAVILNDDGDTVAGLNPVATINVVAGQTGGGYVAGRVYPTTKLVSANSGATGIVVKVNTVNGTGGVTSVSIYSNGKNWTIGDTFTIDYFVAGPCRCQVLSLSPTTNISVNSWRGMSGRVAISNTNFERKIIPSFESTNDIYPSQVEEYISTGVSATFTTGGYFLVLGTPTSFTPQDGYNLLVAKDVGIRTTKDDANIKLGSADNGFNFTAASDIVAIGTDTGRAITTGDNNILIGRNAGYNLTTSSNNISLGKSAGAGQTGSIQTETIFIGRLAGSGAIGSLDIAIGSGAGNDLTNTTDDPAVSVNMARIAIGGLSMGGSTRRYNVGEVAIGANSSISNTTTLASSSGFGVYIGESAGRNVAASAISAVDSGHHVAVGSGAMYWGGTARKGQIAIGYKASIGVFQTQTETYNSSTYGIAIGYEAEGVDGDYGLITRAGVGNIAIGYRAASTVSTNILGGTIAIGSSAMAQGTNSISIGTNSDAGDNLKNNSIAIGFGAQSKFANSVALGTDATANDANQFVVGSSSAAVGTVANGVIIPNKTWTVKINGIDYKIPILTA